MLFLWLWVLVITAALLTAGILWAGYRITNGEENFPGTSLDGIALGGLTREETIQILKSNNWDARNDLPLDVSLPLNISFRLDRMRAGAALTCEEAAEYLHTVGRQGNWVENLKSWVSAFFGADSMRFSRENLPRPGFDNEYLFSNIRAATDSFAARTADSDLHLDRERQTLSLVKGGGSVSIDSSCLYEAVTQALLSDE